MKDLKITDLKRQAYALCSRLVGKIITQTPQIKKRLGAGLDLRSKAGWVAAIARLQEMLNHGIIQELLAA